MVKFILAQTSGVHLSGILCYYPFNDSFTFNNICIRNCAVYSQQHNTWLHYLFLSQHNREERSQTEDGLQDTVGIRLSANTSRAVSQTTRNVLTATVPTASLTSIPKCAVRIYMIRRVVWTRSLFPMVLQLLSVTQHNTDVSLHLCFFLRTAGVHSLLEQCLFPFA